MKKLILTLGLVVAVALVSFGQTTETDRNTQTQMDQKKDKDSKKMKLDETPDKVQEAFKNSEYKKENVKEVHEVSEGMNKFYKVVVDVDNKKWALKYDEQGNLLETKEHKKY